MTPMPELPFMSEIRRMRRVFFKRENMFETLERNADTKAC